MKVAPGDRFGRLLVLSVADQRANSATRCRCDCGKETTPRALALISGHTRSCGCLSPETARALFVRHGHATGGKTTGEYAAWLGMKRRCYSVKMRAYPLYGGRGITVCDRWRDSFPAFLADMGPRPSPQHSVDRYPNKDGNYEPGNCRWATKGEQSRNTNRNRLVTFRGETLCVTDWAARLGVGKHAISSRLFGLGWSVEKALTTPFRGRAGANKARAAERKEARRG